MLSLDLGMARRAEVRGFRNRIPASRTGAIGICDRTNRSLVAFPPAFCALERNNHFRLRATAKQSQSGHGTKNPGAGLMVNGVEYLPALLAEFLNIFRVVVRVLVDTDHRFKRVPHVSSFPQSKCAARIIPHWEAR